MNTTCERKDFLPVVPSYLDEYGLDPMEYRLYSHIVRRAGKDGCFESIPNMARNCLMNEKTVRKALRVLTAARLIKAVQERKGKTSIYELTQPSEWVDTQNLPAIRQEFTTNRVHHNLANNNNTPSKSGTTKNGTGSKSGRGVVPDQVGVVVPNQVGLLVPDLVDEVYPIKVIPSKEFTLSTAPPNKSAPPTHESVCEESELPSRPNQKEKLIPGSSSSQPNQEEPIPKSLTLRVSKFRLDGNRQDSNLLTSLSNKSESPHQHENLSCGKNTTPPPFDKVEQPNKSVRQDPFLNNRTFNPLKNTPKSNASDPWMKTANMPNEEFAQWLFEKRYKHQPGKMLADAKAEIRNSFERASDLWDEFLSEKQPTPSTASSDSEFSPIGYYSNRSLDWHKATFNEFLDRVDEVGLDKAIASFSTRYDQQHPDATDTWLGWLKLTHPQMYAYLEQQAA
jgi:hypothetical protein